MKAAQARASTAAAAAGAAAAPHGRGAAISARTARTAAGGGRGNTVRIRRGTHADLGWVLEQHATMYLREFGYRPVFVAYVTEGFGPYLRSFDPGRDRLWLAELGGQRVGCIAVHHDPKRPGWAKLRWYLVTADARGHGLGRRLLRACLAFCRRAGYEGIYLWTVDDLQAARALYEAAGFTLAEQTDGCVWAPWGHEQRWELRLRRRPPSRATQGRAPVRKT